MWKWRTDDIPHPLTGWKPEDQTKPSRRRTAKPGGAKPSTLPNKSGFSPDAPSSSTLPEPITPQDGKGKGNSEGKGPNIHRATKNPTGKSTRELALAEKPEALTCPRLCEEKGTKLPEPNTPGLEEKAPGLMMSPGYRIAEPSAGNPLCLEICDVKFGGPGCPYCNPNFTNVFIWADYIGRVDKCIPPPVRVDLKTRETEEWVTYRYIAD